MVDVYVDVERVVGSVEVVTQAASSKVRVSIPRVIGSVEVFTGQGQDVRVSVSRVVGAVRLGVRPLGSIWVSLGLPCVMQDQYQYTNEPGLSRTLMQDGDVRQRVRWLNHPRPLSVRVTLDLDQMVDLETLIHAVGAGTWMLPLITGDGTMTMHAVRCTGPAAFNAIHKLQFEATIPLEAL